MRRLIVLLTVLILGCPMPDGMRVQAGCPKVVCVKKQAVVLQAVQYVPQYYQVGAQVQQEAIVEAAVARALARFAATVTTQTTTTQATLGSQATAQVQSAGQFQRCAKCHTGPNRTGFRVDVDLSCEDRLLAIGRLLHDDDAKRMPKGVQISDQERGLLIQAFAAGAPTVRASAPPPEPMPPAPGTQP